MAVVFLDILLLYSIRPMDIPDVAGCLLGFSLLDKVQKLLVFFDGLLFPLLHKSLLTGKIVEPPLEIIRYFFLDEYWHTDLKRHYETSDCSGNKN